MSADDIVRAWAARGRRLVVPGAGTTVWEEGSGEAVVCPHGVPASAFPYRNLLPELAAWAARRARPARHRLRPAGPRSRRPPVAAGLQPVGPRRVVGGGRGDARPAPAHLVVHDIGGPVGFDLVARMPQRIASLTAGKHVVPEDAPGTIAEHVVGLTG